MIYLAVSTQYRNVADRRIELTLRCVYSLVWGRAMTTRTLTLFFCCSVSKSLKLCSGTVVW